MIGVSWKISGLFHPEVFVLDGIVREYHSIRSFSLEGFNVDTGWTLEYPQTKFGDNRKYMVEYFGLDLLVFRPFGRI